MGWEAEGSRRERRGHDEGDTGRGATLRACIPTLFLPRLPLGAARLHPCLQTLAMLHWGGQQCPLPRKVVFLFFKNYIYFLD